MKDEMEKSFITFCFYICVCLCELCSAQRRAIPDYLEPKKVYILDSKWCPQGQLPQRNDSVCCFPVACSKDHEVEPCSLNGTEDQCVPCQTNYIQPNNVSSLNMVEASCFKILPVHEKCPLANFKPYRHSIETQYDWPCVCLSEHCWIHISSIICIILPTAVCGINQQLNSSTKQCEQCPWYAYKNELGCHSCTINITLLRQGSSDRPYRLLTTQLAVPTTNGIYPTDEGPKTDPVTEITNGTTGTIIVMPMIWTNTIHFPAIISGIAVGSLFIIVLTVVLIARLKRYFSGKCGTREISASDQERASLMHCSSLTTGVNVCVITVSEKPDTQNTLAVPVSDRIDTSANKNNNYSKWGQQDKPTARVGPIMAFPTSPTIQDNFDYDSNMDNSDYSVASYPILHQSLNSMEAGSIRNFSSLVTQGSSSMAIAQKMNDIDQSIEQEEVNERQVSDGFCDFESERTMSPILFNQVNNMANHSEMGSLSVSVIDNNMVADVLCMPRHSGLSPQPACEMDNDGISRFNSVLPLQRPRPEGQSLSLSNTNNRSLGRSSQWNTMRKQLETFEETFPKTVENEHTFTKAVNVASVNIKADVDDEIDESSFDFNDLQYTGDSQDSNEQKPAAEAQEHEESMEFISGSRESCGQDLHSDNNSTDVRE